MRRRLAYVLVPLAILGISGAVISCGQQVGDRCQVNSDCASGLICNDGTGLCQPMNQDASMIPAPDAHDGGPIDAHPDAPVDAMVDAN